MKNLFSVIIDSIFCAFIVFIVSKFILSLLIRNDLSIGFSIMLAVCCWGVFFRWFNKKRTFNKITLAEQKKARLSLTQLAFMSDLELCSLFYSAFSKLNLKPQRRGNKIFLPEKNCLVFFCFSLDGIRKSQVIKYYNLLQKNQTAVIFGREFSSEIKDFCRYFENKIILVDGEKTFFTLKKADVFPENKILFFVEKKKTFDFSLLLHKKRAKNYFIFGLLFLLYSFIVPIKLYYIILGSLLLIFSLLCALFGKQVENSNF
ncbi:MAG: hypothetical protein IJW43_02820 [Clostridia bacterium]|nr:hypothetical protein [Clostridia bacterium]